MDASIVQCPHCGAKNKIPLRKQHLNPKCGRCKHPLPMQADARPVTLTDQNFEEFVVSAQLPVFVDFFSMTCGPCQMLAPVIEALAKKYFGRLIVAKVNVSENPMTATRYQVRGVPTLIFLKNGRLLDQVVGAIPEASLVQKIDNFLR